jgi:hypothetical protein
MHHIQHFKQKPIARQRMILFALLTLVMAGETNVLVAGHAAVTEAAADCDCYLFDLATQQTSIATRA